MSTLMNDRSEAAQGQSPASRSMSFEEFLEWVDEDAHVEWVNGKVVPMAPINDEHADVSSFLLMLLRHWAEAQKSGIVRCEPVLMKTAVDLPARAPDVLFLSNANLAR